MYVSNLYEVPQLTKLPHAIAKMNSLMLVRIDVKYRNND